MFHPKDKDRMTEVRSAVHGNLNANNENRHRSTAANDSHVNDPQLYTFGVDTNRTMTMRARSSDRHHDLHQNAFVIYDSEGKQLHCPSGHHTNRNSLDHNGPKKDQDALHPRTNDRTNSGTSDGSYHIRYNKYMDQRGYHHFQDFNDSHELGEGLSVGGRESDERRLHYFFACGDSFERRRHRQRYESSVYTSHDAKYYATVQQRDDSYRKRNEIHGGSNRRYIDHDYHNKIGRNNDDCFDHPFNRDHEHHSHQRHLRDLGSLKSSINLHSYQDRRGTRLFAPHPARHENNGNKRNRSRHEDSRHGIPRHGNAQGDTTSQGQPTEGFGKIEQQKKRLREHSPLKTSLRQNHQEDHHQGWPSSKMRRQIFLPTFSGPSNRPMESSWDLVDFVPGRFSNAKATPVNSSSSTSSLESGEIPEDDHPPSNPISKVRGQTPGSMLKPNTSPVQYTQNFKKTSAEQGAKPINPRVVSIVSRWIH